MPTMCPYQDCDCDHCDDQEPYLLMHLHPRDLDSLAGKNRTAVVLPIDEVLQTLNDLITYFQLPDAELEHEEKQIKLRSLKNRQNLFKQEVSVFTSFQACINKPSLSSTCFTDRPFPKQKWIVQFFLNHDAFLIT